MVKKQVKKRNPTDSTMRNINALKKRVKKLEDAMKIAQGAIEYLFRRDPQYQVYLQTEKK